MVGEWQQTPNYHTPPPGTLPLHHPKPPTSDQEENWGKHRNHELHNGEKITTHCETSVVMMIKSEFTPSKLSLPVLSNPLLTFWSNDMILTVLSSRPTARNRALCSPAGTLARLMHLTSVDISFLSVYSFN